jgi:hypothetical protein
VGHYHKNKYDETDMKGQYLASDYVAKQELIWNQGQVIWFIIPTSICNMFLECHYLHCLGSQL